MTLATAIEETASKFPGKTAIEFEGCSISFHELINRIDSTARYFSEEGIIKGDRIVFFSPASPALIYYMLAALKTGVILVPVNHQFKEQELLHILRDSDAKAIAIDEELIPLLQKIQHHLPCLQKIFLLNQDKTRVSHSAFNNHLKEQTTDTDLAALFYTSGTTGKPKGAALTHRNILFNLRSLQQVWDWSHNDVLLHTLPLYHVHGFCIALCGSLLTGNKILLKKKFDAAEVLRTIGERKVTLFMGVPTMYYKILCESGSPRDLSSMRLFISGSAPLSCELFKAFREKFGFEILERAGMSETLMNFSNPVHGERTPGSVGLPLPGVEVRIVNERFEDQPAGKEGEILLRGENVFTGYWNNPKTNAECFVNGWFHTGDIGKADNKGYIYIIGRKKDVIKSGGILIFPREIESVIESIPGIKECAVIGVPDEQYGESIKACVVKEDDSISEADVLSVCKNNLASFKKPKSIEFLQALPKNSMGKVLKEVLRRNHSTVR